MSLCKNVNFGDVDTTEARQLISSVCNFLDESKLKTVFHNYTAAMFPDLTAIGLVRDQLHAAHPGMTLHQFQQSIRGRFPGVVFQTEYLFNNRVLVFEGYDQIATNTYNIGSIGSSKIGLNVTASSLKISYYKANNQDDGLNNMELTQKFNWDTHGSAFSAGTKLDDINGPRVNFAVCANILKIVAKVMKIENIGLRDAAAMPCLGPSRANPIMFSTNQNYLDEKVQGGNVGPATKAPNNGNSHVVQVSHISIVRIIAGKGGFYRLAQGIPYDNPTLNLRHNELVDAVLAITSDEDKSFCRDYLADAKPSKTGMLNFLTARFTRNNTTEQCIDRCVEITRIVNDFLDKARIIVEQRGMPNPRATAENILFNWLIPTGYTPGYDAQQQSVIHRAARSAERQSVERVPIGFNPLKWWGRRKYSVARKKLSHLINRPGTQRPHRRLNMNDLYPRQTYFQRFKRFGRNTWDFLKHLRRRTSAERIFSAKKRAIKRYSGARRRLGLTARISQKRRLGLQTQRRR